METLKDFQYKFFNPVKSSRPGSHFSHTRGSGMIFNRLISLEQYPDPRRLDLRSSLIDPYERWLVREYKQKSAITVMLILDVSASTGFRGSLDGVKTISQIISSVVLSANRYGDRIGLIGFDNAFRKEWYYHPSKRSKIAMEDITKNLIVNIRGRGHRGLQNVPNWLPKERALIFFISDFHLSTKLFKTFLDTTTLHQIVPIVLEDPVEQDGYNQFGFAFLQDSESGKKKLVFLTEQFRRRLKKNYSNKSRNTKSICEAFGIKPFYVKGYFNPNKLTEYFYGGQVF